MDRFEGLHARFLEEPLAKTLGAVLVDISDGRALVRIDRVREETCIVGGIAQGGTTTALADYAGVYAAMTRIPEGHTLCKHISIDLLRPVMVGEVLYAASGVVNDSRRELLVTVSVFTKGGEDRPKARATLTYAKPRRRQSI